VSNEASKKTFLVINGPNLNLLGKREPEIYGADTLESIQEYTEEKLKNYPISMDWFQSNIEGEIVERIHLAIGCEKNVSSIIINPGAYSHTSIAILDALKCFKGSIVEVHLSNTHVREEFRKERITVNAADAIIEGVGKKAYYLGILSQIEN
jgi:3-dehydroquinate dehydratase II